MYSAAKIFDNQLSIGFYSANILGCTTIELLIIIIMLYATLLMW